MTAKALRRLRDLPGPSGLPFLGNALEFRSSALHLKLENWARIYGPYYPDFDRSRLFSLVSQIRGCYKS